MLSKSAKRRMRRDAVAWQKLHEVFLEQAVDASRRRQQSYDSQPLPESDSRLGTRQISFLQS